MKKVYALYDKAIAAYATPFIARTDGEAVRMFISSLAGNDEFRSHAHDYSLCFLSEYNELTGEFGVPDDQRLVVPRIVMVGTVAAAHCREMVEPPAGEMPALEAAKAI